MKTLAKENATGTMAVAIAVFGLFVGMGREARAADSGEQTGPMVKNLMAPTYRPPVAPAAVSHELTKKEVKRLAATAESSADHWKLVRYYTAQADKLESQAAGYEAAAVTYSHGPMVKNLMAPGTPGRYEFFAKELRDSARSDRTLAALHEKEALAAL
jgi:hypothetical protein